MSCPECRGGLQGCPRRNGRCERGPVGCPTCSQFNDTSEGSPRRGVTPSASGRFSALVRGCLQ